MRQRLVSLAALIVFGVTTAAAALADTQVYIVNSNATGRVRYQIRCGTNGAWNTITINPGRKQGYDDCATSFYVRFRPDNQQVVSYRLNDGTVNTFTWYADAQIWKLTSRPMRDDE